MKRHPPPSNESTLRFGLACQRAPTQTPLGLGEDAPAEAMLRGADWPFLSRAEQADWLATSVCAAAAHFADAVNRVSAASLGAEAARSCSAASDAAAFKRARRALCTAVHLDAGAALTLIHEAIGMLTPVLQEVALSDAAAAPNGGTQSADEGLC